MQGIIYIALGDKYFEMASSSIRSIYDFYQGKVPEILVLSDRDIESKYLPPNISVKKIGIEYPSDPGIATAYLKTRLHDLSPFDTTLYLDCDVMAVDDISRIWSYSGNKIAVAPAYNPIREGTKYCDSECEYTRSSLAILGDFTQYNTGVFLFDKSRKMENAFNIWLNEWKIYRNHENMAFNRLVAAGLEVNELPSTCNDFYPHKSERSKLVHYIGNYKNKLDAYIFRDK